MPRYWSVFGVNGPEMWLVRKLQTHNPCPNRSPNPSPNPTPNPSPSPNP